MARYLKERNPQVLAIVVETQGSVLGGGPKGEHEVEGIGASFIPKTCDLSLADEIIAVSDHDAFDMVKKLAAIEGVLAGSSAGAAVFAAIDIARRLGPGKRVATIIPDSAERYLSKDIFHFNERKRFSHGDVSHGETRSLILDHLLLLIRAASVPPLVKLVSYA